MRNESLSSLRDLHVNTDSSIITHDCPQAGDNPRVHQVDREAKCGLRIGGILPVGEKDQSASTRRDLNSLRS